MPEGLVDQIPDQAVLAEVQSAWPQNVLRPAPANANAKSLVCGHCLNAEDTFTSWCVWQINSFTEIKVFAPATKAQEKSKEIKKIL